MVQMPALVALEPGPFVTLQDRGRPGWKRFGVSGAGAVDLAGLFAANALVGNPAETPALEFGYSGGAWHVEADSVRVAVGGGSFQMFADDRSLAPWTSTTLYRGQHLRLSGAPDAVWGYLAVAGGFDVAQQFGSASTHKRSGVGGAGFVAGDVLRLRRATAPAGAERTLAVTPPAFGRVVRVVLGPQDNQFLPEALRLFTGEEFTVTMRCDRLGYRLSGPDLTTRSGAADVISDGVVPGSVQVPGDGQPIVLMPDCQPPGGYPKIATVISASLSTVAQSRPGTKLRFQFVSIGEAHLLRRDYLAGLHAMAGQTTPVDPSDQPTFP